MVGIKDIKMPKNCDECRLWSWGRDDKPYCRITCNLIMSFCKRDEDCPLVEIDSEVNA